MKKTSYIALTLLLAAASLQAVVVRSSSPGSAVGPAANCANTVDGTGGAVDTIVYTETGTISDVNVRTEITHTWRGDLQFHVSYSVGAAGNIVLALDDDGSADDYYATFDDESANGACDTVCAVATDCTMATPVDCTPDVALSAFDGLTSPGTWTFAVCDDAGGDGGTLNLWEMQVSGNGGLPVELMSFGVE